MRSLLSMLRTETPMTSGWKERAAARAAAWGSEAKHRSATRTVYPAWSNADATHATPLGTTGIGCRSRLVLTRSTRGRDGGEDAAGRPRANGADRGASSPGSHVLRLSEQECASIDDVRELLRAGVGRLERDRHRGAV